MLNSAQQVELDAIIAYTLDEILGKEDIDDAVKIAAIDAISITSNAIPEPLAQRLRDADLYEEVEFLHRCIVHKNPQNRSDNDPYVYASEDPNYVRYKDFNGKAQLEERGLLSLSNKNTKNEAGVTKKDVVDRIKMRAEEAKAKIKKGVKIEISERDQQIAQENEKIKSLAEAAGVAFTPALQQKMIPELRGLILSGKIPMAQFAQLELIDIFRYYRPLAVLFDQGVLEFEAYINLPENNKKIFLAAFNHNASAQNYQFLQSLLKELKNINPDVAQNFLKYLEDKNNLVPLDNLTEIMDRFRYIINEAEIRARARVEELKRQNAVIWSRVPDPLKKLAENNKIPEQFLRATETQVLIDLYLPLATFLASGAIKFENLQTLSEDNRQILMQILKNKKTGVTDLFMTTLIAQLTALEPEASKRLLSMLNSNTSILVSRFDELNENTLARFILFSSSIGSSALSIREVFALLPITEVISVEQCLALSTFQKNILVHFIRGGAYVVNTDAPFIIALYNNILNADPVFLEALSDNFRYLESTELPGMVAKVKAAGNDNPLQAANNQFEQVLENELKSFEQSTIGITNDFLKGQDYGNRTLAELKKTRPSVLAYLAPRTASNIVDFQVKLLEKIKTTANTEIQTVQTYSAAGYSIYIPDEETASRERINKIRQHIAKNINLNIPAEFKFVERIFPNEGKAIRAEAIEAQLQEAYAYNPRSYLSNIFNISSQLFFLKYIETGLNNQQSKHVDNVVYVCTEPYVQSPPMTFLLDKRLLNRISPEAFKCFFRNPVAVQALLTKDALAKLSNEQIFMLFDHIAQNNKEDLKKAKRLEANPQYAAAFRGGDSRWSEVIETMKDCVFKNALKVDNIKEETKAGNLLKLAKDPVAQKLLGTDASDRSTFFSKPESATLLSKYAAEQTPEMQTKVEQYATSRANRIEPPSAK